MAYDHRYTVAGFRKSSNQLLVRDLHCYPQNKFTVQVSYTCSQISFTWNLTVPVIFWINEWTKYQHCPGLRKHSRITGQMLLLWYPKHFSSFPNIELQVQYWYKPKILIVLHLKPKQFNLFPKLRFSHHMVTELSCKIEKPKSYLQSSD